MGIELEQKYLLVSHRPWLCQQELLSRLSQGGYGVRFVGEAPQEDTYYDTQEDFFLSQGGSLRLRRKGDSLLMTLKLPVDEKEGGPLARREEESEVGGEKELLQRLGGQMPEMNWSSLRPTAVVENLRRTYEVTDASGFKAELAFDAVCYKNPASGKSASERQVEIERCSGSFEDLVRLVDDTAGKMGELQPLRASKYQRAREQTALW